MSAMPLASNDDPRVQVVTDTLRRSAATTDATFRTDARRILAALDRHTAPARMQVTPERVDAAVVAYMDAPRDEHGRVPLEDLMRHILTVVLTGGGS